MLYIIAGFAVVVVLMFFAWRNAAPSPTHAGGLVYRQQEGRALYLIVSSLSHKDKWVLPKGRIEKNETPEFAAVREVMEETGIKATPVKNATTIMYKKKGRRITVVYFLMQFQEFYNTSAEKRQLKWVGKEEAMQLLGPHNSSRVLEHV